MSDIPPPAGWQGRTEPPRPGGISSGNGKAIPGTTTRGRSRLVVPIAITLVLALSALGWLVARTTGEATVAPVPTSPSPSTSSASTTSPPSEATWPDFTGMPLDEAQAEFADFTQGKNLGELRIDSMCSVEQTTLNRVRVQIPQAGSPAVATKGLTIIVAKTCTPPTQPATTYVAPTSTSLQAIIPTTTAVLRWPNVVGISLSAARSRLSNLLHAMGAEMGYMESICTKDEALDMIVAAQFPPAGSVVRFDQPPALSVYYWNVGTCP